MMTWRPPTSEELDARAMNYYREAREAWQETVAGRYRLGGTLCIVGALVGIIGTGTLLLLMSDMERMLAAGPAIAALILILMGRDYRRMFRPLPKYLFATGTPMDAVVLSADAAGPSLEIDGASYVRTSYLLEV